MNSPKVNVNVTRFLGENAQVNAITFQSMKGRVVLIDRRDVTIASRYRGFEWSVIEWVRNAPPLGRAEIKSFSQMVPLHTCAADIFRYMCFDY